jgi:hypothetical protein
MSHVMRATSLKINSMPNANESRNSKKRSVSNSVTFGNVTISGEKPSKAMIKKHVAASAEGLQRLSERLTKPGVSIRAKRDVPMFWASDDEAGVYFRKLNEVVVAGTFVDGEFRVKD